MEFLLSFYVFDFHFYLQANIAKRYEAEIGSDDSRAPSDQQQGNYSLQTLDKLRYF